VRHEADHRLKVFSDVPDVSYQVVAVGSQASAEMLALGKHVEHSRFHSLGAEDMVQVEAVSSGLIAYDQVEALFVH
jgi:hypothetical protein